jgi:hypothetical protein
MMCSKQHTDSDHLVPVLYLLACVYISVCPRLKTRTQVDGLSLMPASALTAATAIAEAARRRLETYLDTRLHAPTADGRLPGPEGRLP